MGLIVLATVSYALMVVALSRGPLFADANIVGTIINLVGAMVPFALFVQSGMKLGDFSGPTLTGLAWAVAGGIGIASFTLTMARIFQVGGQLGVVSPLVYGGAIVIVTLVGVFMFRERIGAWQVAGLLLVTAGLGCIVYARYRPGAAVP